MTKGVSFDGGPIGYKRPPAEHQFKKGQKPASSGRRRQSENFETLIGALLEERVTVIENGRKRRMSRKEALVRKAFARAMGGSMNDVARLIAIIDRLAPTKMAVEPQVMLIRTIPGDEDL